MRRAVRRRGSGIVAAVGAAALVLAAPLPVSADGHVAVDGVFSPLGFAVGSDGTFYVAEAFLGKITAVDKKGERSTIVEGPEGQFTSGVDAAGKGTVSYTLSLPPEFGEQPSDTTLNRILPNGRTQTLRSLFEYEEDANPDQVNLYGLVDASEACLAQYEEVAAQFPDDFPPAVFPGIVESNPYAVAIDSDGSRIVADAAGNTIVRVSANGRRVGTAAVLPPITQALTEDAIGGLPLAACVGEPYASNPVPTDVEIGPDGDYYVSALPGFPESPGAGRVYRVDRMTGAVSEVASGFSGAVDLAVAGDGTIYVAELFGFQVSVVEPGADHATDAMFVPCPTAVEVGPDGTVYAAEGGICAEEPELGRIVRL